MIIFIPNLLIKTMKELLTSEALLTNFKDVRTLTRKVIETFPEKDLFEFSIANLRPFSQMVEEFLMITDSQKYFTKNIPLFVMKDSFLLPKRAYWLYGTRLLKSLIMNGKK